jgi:hypothetical protein
VDLDAREANVAWEQLQPKVGENEEAGNSHLDEPVTRTDAGDRGACAAALQPLAESAE